MTQEEIKNLLLQDISARLSYGVIISVIDINGFKFDGELRVISNGWCKLKISDTRKRARVKNEIIPLNSVYIKPYLRPLSSMTEEERNELRQLMNCDAVTDCSLEYAVGGCVDYDDFLVYYEDSSKLTDWLNKKMFDYRDLIPKGLALEAPEGMYNN